MHRIVFALSLFVCLSRVALAQDMRSTFGTRSLAAATALDKGIKLVQGQKAAEALPELDKAIKADPNLGLAYYWKALAFTDLGEVDEALKQYELIVVLAKREGYNSVTVDACVNAGITLGKLKQERDASIWFTRAIMFDPKDEFKLHARAYRNMAIGHHEQGRNLTAGLCAMLGYNADPKKVERDMVLQFLEKAESDEVAQLLTFDDETTEAKPRGVPSSLGQATPVPDINGQVWQLISDVAGNRVVALAVNDPKYYVIDSSPEHKVQMFEMPAQPTSACVAGGKLYLAVAGEGIVEVEISSGAVLKKWALKETPRTGLAVIPSKGVAIFSLAGVLNVLDLETSSLTKTEFCVFTVQADPLGQFVYGFTVAEARPEVGHIIVNGRPVLLQSSQANWMQTALFKFAVAGKIPMLAEIRMNSASNGRMLHISDDGRWVGIAGGGGWRPQNNGGHKAGYGVALFGARDLSHIQGFYNTEAYPLGLAVNAVTGQIAAVRADDAKIYDLADEVTAVSVPGKHAGAALWSPDGRTLYLAGEKELRAVSNTLADAELVTAANLQKQHAALPSLGAVKPVAASSAPSEAIAEYATFEIKNDKNATLQAIQVAEASGRTDKPLEWLRHAPYQQDKQLQSRWGEFVNKMDRTDAGLRIYQLKKLKQEHPTHPGVDFLLGMSYFAAGQLDAALASHVAAIRADRAQTNITTEALRCLAHLKKQKNEPLAAAYCCAHVMRLDRGSAEHAAEMEPLFKAAGLEAQAKTLLALGKQAGQAATVRVSGELELPALPLLGNTRKLPADVLFRGVAQSVVLIKSDDGAGSGVCIGAPGLIVTNAHVVGERQNTVQVHRFELVNGQLEKRDPLDGQVIFKSADEDLAIVRVADPPKSLRAMYMADSTPSAGNRVFAVGNPGLGGEILEQTITEGIVSHAERKLRDKVFLQHTAAVNPGNSGGPLFDEYGQIIGIVTAKAELENVSFAIPATSVRAIFAKYQKKP